MQELQKKDTDGLLSKSVISCMSKALYSEKTLGHYGLALEYYSHFTSPIRRYPDLQIHRILKMFLKGELTETEKKNLTETLPEKAKRTS